MTGVPRIAVVISAWRAAGTIRACLDSLAAQSYGDFEVQLVDGGPDHAVQSAAADYPFVHYTRIDEFCTMHRKRNVGVAQSNSELIVFSDPDIVADAEWLQQLADTWDRHQRPVAGAIACHGERMADRIVHLIKFDYWLPGKQERPVEAAATANMLVSRAHFAEVGGFDEGTYLGDLKLSRDLAEAGHTLIFCPSAVVEHDHEGVALLPAVREHWRRGREFQQMRSQPPTLGGIVRHTLLWLPRLMKRSARTVVLGVQGGDALAALLGSPFIVAAHSAWLGGESRSLWVRLIGGEDFTRTPEST